MRTRHAKHCAPASRRGRCRRWYSPAVGRPANGPRTTPPAARPSRCKGADGKYTIGMSQANVAEPYRQRMDDDIQAAAEEVPQFDVKFADAAQDNAKQVADVENYLTQQIDLLIISPNEAKPLTAVVKKAYDRGVGRQPGPDRRADRGLPGGLHGRRPARLAGSGARSGAAVLRREPCPRGGSAQRVRGASALACSRLTPRRSPRNPPTGGNLGP